MQSHDKNQELLLGLRRPWLGREFGSAFGRQFSHEFGREFGREFGHEFGHEFGREFGREFGLLVYVCVCVHFKLSFWTVTLFVCVVYFAENEILYQ